MGIGVESSRVYKRGRGVEEMGISLHIFFNTSYFVKTQYSCQPTCLAYVSCSGRTLLLCSRCQLLGNRRRREGEEKEEGEEEEGVDVTVLRLSARLLARIGTSKGLHIAVRNGNMTPSPSPSLASACAVLCLPILALVDEHGILLRCTA